MVRIQSLTAPFRPPISSMSSIAMATRELGDKTGGEAVGGEEKEVREEHREDRSREDERGQWI